MRSGVARILAAGFVVCASCTQSATPSAASKPDAVQPDLDQQRSTNSAPPKPALGFRVTWPGEPKEMWPDDVGKDSWTYHASYFDKRRRLLYSASAIELGPAVANMALRERLTNFKAGLQSHELSRVETEYGPAKLPALEICAKAGGKDERVQRELVVLSGTRVYEVAVIGLSKAAVETQEVLAFLHSLEVDQ